MKSSSSTILFIAGLQLFAICYITQWWSGTMTRMSISGGGDAKNSNNVNHDDSTDSLWMESYYAWLLASTSTDESPPIDSTRRMSNDPNANEADNDDDGLDDLLLQVNWEDDNIDLEDLEDSGDDDDDDDGVDDADDQEHHEQRQHDEHNVSTNKRDRDNRVATNVVSSSVVKAKPLLIFHVGPPKTATTSLQADLTSFRPALERDGYFYGGRYYEPSLNAKKTRIVLNRSDTKIITHAVVTWKVTKGCRRRIQSYCFEPLKQELQPYQELGQSIILSDEAMGGNSWKNRPHVYRSLVETLGDDWDFLVIASYRHFYDWMPSNKFQRDRLDRDNLLKQLWPTETMGEYKGREILPLFPFALDNWANQELSFTSNVIRTVNGTMPIKILDLTQIQDGSSIRSEFLCQMVPHADYACRKSRDKDGRVQRLTVLNTAEKVVHPSYDMVTTRAAAQGWINTTRYTRELVRRAFREYVEQSGGSHKDFPLECPTKEQLAIFLEGSIQLQRATFGDNVTETMEASHRAGFQKKADSQSFCSVDTTAILQKFQPFFAQFQ